MLQIAVFYIPLIDAYGFNALVCFRVGRFVHRAFALQRCVLTLELFDTRSRRLQLDCAPLDALDDRVRLVPYWSRHSRLAGTLTRTCRSRSRESVDSRHPNT